MNNHLIFIIIGLSVMLSCNRNNDGYPKLQRIQPVPYLQSFNKTQFDTLLDAENYCDYRFSDKLVMKIQYRCDSTLKMNDTTIIYYPNEGSPRDSLYISFYSRDTFTRISFDEARRIDPYFVNGLNKFSIYGGRGLSHFICRKGYYVFVDLDGRKRHPYNHGFMSNLYRKTHHFFNPYERGTLSVFDRNYNLERNIHFLSDDLLLYKPVSLTIIKDRYAVVSTIEYSVESRMDEKSGVYFLYFFDIVNNVLISRTRMYTYRAVESINDTLYMSEWNNNRLWYSRFDFGE